MVGRRSTLPCHKICRPYSGAHFWSVCKLSRVKCVQTPDHGINFSTPVDIKSPIREGSDRPLGWYRTMIETTRTQTHSWPSISQGRTLHSCLFPHLLDSRLGVSGFGLSRPLCPRCDMFPERLDVSWKVTALFYAYLIFFMFKRCVIAVLNSNMEVSLWAAGKNHLKGEWLSVGSSCLCENLRLILTRYKMSLHACWTFHDLRV